MFAESLVRLLEGEPDVEVCGIAASLEEARTVAAAERPDVVLLDYGLPDADGVEAVATLGRDVPAAKFVMLTGRTDEPTLSRAMQAGCAGLLTKDRAADELVAAIRSAAGDAPITPGELELVLGPRAGTERKEPGDLTPRELEVVALLAEGLATQDIAEHLVLSVKTVRNHVQNAITKLGAHSKLEAVAIASRRGLVTRPGAGPG